MKREGDCRDWHYLTKLNTTTVPSSLMFVQTGTYSVPDATHKSKSWEHLRLWVAKALRLDNGTVSREATERSFHHEAFWEFVYGRLDKKRPLWIFCDNLGKVMTLLKLWQLVIDHKYEFCQMDGDAKTADGGDKPPVWTGLAVLADPPSFLRMRLKGQPHTIVIVDIQNYFRQPLSEIATSLGQQPRKLLPETVHDSTLADCCLQDVCTIQEAMIALITLVRTEGLGRFSYTIPSQAMAAFRAKFLPDDHTILVHGNERALQLERDSYHSGAVHNWYIGRVRNFTFPQAEVSSKINGSACIPAPIYHYDVQSFYPSIMVAEKFPIRLTRYNSRPDYEQLAYTDESYASVAQVKLECKAPGYPVTRDGKTFYAQGRVCTALAGPELDRAIKEGCIRSVQAIATYEVWPVFRDFAEFFIGQRKYYKSKGNNSFALACKLLANSLYGKFGQWRWLWDNDETRQAPIPLGTWPESRQLTESEILDALKDGEYASEEEAKMAIRTEVYRSICWLAQKRGARQEHKDSCPAIASFVTAYGRERILYLAAAAGIENCLYADTDSLHVTREGHLQLCEKGLVDEGTAGLLCLKSIGRSAHYRGPKDYTFNEQETIAGRKQSATNLPNSGYLQMKGQRLQQILEGKQLDGIAQETIEVRPAVHHRLGWIGPDGRTEPPLLCEW